MIICRARGREFVDGLEEMARALHPEAFKVVARRAIRDVKRPLSKRGAISLARLLVQVNPKWGSARNRFNGFDWRQRETVETVSDYLSAFRSPG